MKTHSLNEAQWPTAGIPGREAQKSLSCLGNISSPTPAPQTNNPQAKKNSNCWGGTWAAGTRSSGMAGCHHPSIPIPANVGIWFYSGITRTLRGRTRHTYHRQLQPSPLGFPLSHFCRIMVFQIRQEWCEMSPGRRGA